MTPSADPSLAIAVDEIGSSSPTRVGVRASLRSCAKAPATPVVSTCWIRL